MHMHLTLNMEFLPMELLYRTIKDTDPLQGVSVNEKNIQSYLKRVNGILAEHNVGLEELQGHYVIAASIYTFIHPVLGLDLDEVKENFLGILGRGPYKVDKPLDLYFQRASEESCEEFFLEVRRRNIPEEVFFKKNKNLGQKVNQELTNLVGQLRKNYSERKHFSFTSYNNVCIPLFRLDCREDVDELEVYLRDNHGQFMMSIPTCFREEG